MKKKIASLIVACSFLLTIGLTKESKAVIGTTSGPAGYIVVGLAWMLVPVLIVPIWIGVNKIDVKRDIKGWNILPLVAAGAFFLAGVIALDSTNGVETIHFQPISVEGCNNAGIDDRECIAYNSELDEINAIAENILSQMHETKKYTPEFARDIWMEYRLELSEESREALKKISEKFIKTIEPSVNNR